MHVHVQNEAILSHIVLIVLHPKTHAMSIIVKKTTTLHSHEQLEGSTGFLKNISN